MNRLKKDLGVLLLDILAVNLAYFLALAFRATVNGMGSLFGEAYRFQFYMSIYLRFAPIYTVLCIVVFYLFHLYGGVWKFAGRNTAYNVVLSWLVTTVIQVVGSMLLIAAAKFPIGRMPLTYYIVGAALQLLFVTVIRFARRFASIEKKRREQKRGKAIVVGAGAMGMLAMQALQDGENYEVWTNLMQQAINAGMTSAELSGGECLTYPQFDEVFLFLKSQGIETYILTNGLLLNSERIGFFLQHTPRAIQVSLYGSSEEAYERVTGKRTFSRVLSNIEAAKDAGLPITIAITPSRFNIDNIRDTIRLVKELDIYYRITFSLVTPRESTGRSKEDSDIQIDDYIELFKFNHIINKGKLTPRKVAPFDPGRETEFLCDGVRCGAGRNSFSIRWDGNMFPCAQMESVVADPIRDGFEVAWKALNKRMESFPQFKKCEECSYSHACSFCPAENEKLGSRYYLNPIWCERTWKMAENGLI